MPSFTKKAIVGAFLHVAGKKQLEKITVRDIVDECGVNRNTFYYYFQDIYAVLEELCGEGIAVIPRGASLADMACAFFGAMSDFAARYPRAARNLALAVGRDGFDRYFSSALENAFAERLLLVRPAYEKTSAHEDAAFLTRAVLGVLAEWFRAEKQEPAAYVSAMLARVCNAFEAGVRAQNP